jgi:NitT/TauT family transport system ATP-binding protein
MDVSVNDLSIRFEDKQIYHHLNLKIRNGEFVCILGRSGCGKTVLLNSILGNIKPLAGSVMVDNEIVCRPTKKIGVVYQDFFILPWLTLRENIQLAASIPFAAITAFLGIDQYLDMLPKEVSIGTKQRASIARALATGANLLLMDEPLSSVDAITSSQIRQEIKQICNGKTVIFITHNISEALFLADRIVCIKHGIISLDNPNSNITEEMILNAI